MTPKAAFQRTCLREARTLGVMKLISLIATSLAFFWSFGIQPVRAQPVIEVSNSYRAVHETRDDTILPGSLMPFDLRTNKYYDRYELHILSAPAKSRIFVIDGADRARNNLSPKPMLDRDVRAGETIRLPKVPSAEGIIVLLRNDGASLSRISVRVDRVGSRSEQSTKQVRKWMAAPLVAMNTMFTLPSLKVSVQPCGVSNAFSTPNIVICTELFAELSDRNLVRAVYPILLHELAHSVLRIWGLPGYDNEDVADEFAAVFSQALDEKSIPEFIAFLESKNSVTEAVVQLTEGGRHTISIQRARNIQRIAANPKDATARWFRLLNPYRQQ